MPMAFANTAQRFETRIDGLGKDDANWAKCCGSVLAKVPVERQNAAINGLRLVTAPGTARR